jgi:hypothetical protein
MFRLAATAPSVRETALSPWVGFAGLAGQQPPFRIGLHICPNEHLARTLAHHHERGPLGGIRQRPQRRRRCRQIPRSQEPGEHVDRPWSHAEMACCGNQRWQGEEGKFPDLGSLVGFIAAAPAYSRTAAEREPQLRISAGSRLGFLRRCSSLNSYGGLWTRMPS